MKKIFSAILMLSTIPAFATGVPSTETTADCDKPTLNTYTGTSNLQADWRPNTIALHWYDGDDELTVPTASQTCTYDGILTPPTTIPTKTGYVFTGWRVRVPVCSFTASEVNGMSGVDYGYKDDSTGLMGAYEENASRYGLTTDNTWATEFNTGIIKGMAKCSAKSGNNGNFTWSNASSNWLATESELTSASGTARYCWCQATNYTPNGGNQCNVSSSSWVFNDDFGNAIDCAAGCARFCAFRGRDYDGFRRAVFGVQ